MNNSLIIFTTDASSQCPSLYEPRHKKTRFFACAKTKTQISFAVAAKLVSAFVFVTRIVQSIYFLNPKFQASSHLLWLHRPVCVGPGRKPRRPVFSQRGSYRPCSKRTNLRGFRPDSNQHVQQHMLARVLICRT